MKYVTARPLSGRVGHQFLDTLTAFIASEMFNLTYCHIPFTVRSRFNSTACMWEKFLNLGYGEPVLSEMLQDRVVFRYQSFREERWKELNYEVVDRLVGALPDEG